MAIAPLSFFKLTQLGSSRERDRTPRIPKFLPEVLVGICVEGSLEMVVGLLGILKADRAYVPLDPAFPKQRLAAMLEDSQVPVLVTSST
jgi:non-ribosomal peptide synthetase component F